MQQFFIELFEYNLYCNQKIADWFITQQNNIPNTAVKLYSHILNAHQIWNNRIAYSTNAFGVWDIHNILNTKTIDLENFNKTQSILKNIDLNTTFKYTNSKGQEFNNKIQDVLFHIINHSTYHRAQIATELKQIGLETLNTDYIFFKR